MENEYGVSPFTLMRALGPAMMIAPFMIWMIASAPLLVYPLARWRAHRDRVVDPQLGVKVALGYFELLAFQIALLGATTVIFTLLSTMGSSERSSAYRFGFGLLVPAGIVLGAHVAMLRRTNQARFPAVHRLLLGYNVIVTGLFGFAAFVFAFEALFAKGSSGDEGRLAGAALVVYGTAWALVGWRFAKLALSDDPSAAAPDAPAPPAAAASGGASLPSLGGGSFPPITSRQ